MGKLKQLHIDCDVICQLNDPNCPMVRAYNEEELSEPPSEFAVVTGLKDNHRTKDWPRHDPDPRNCSGHGQRKCLEEGRHSWFNHSMDSYYANPHLSNLPPGFVEP